MVATTAFDTTAIDESLAVLQEHKHEWARLPIGRKLAYLNELMDRTIAISRRWVDACVQAKRIPPGSPLAGEEWIAGPWALLNGMAGIRRTLQALEKGGPRMPPRLRTRANGQLVAGVFPEKLLDRLVLSAYRTEAWMQEGVTRENLRDTMATFYRQENPTGRVALVLGAGNVSSIAPLDILQKLYVEGQVVVVKMNPIKEYMTPFLEEIFASMIADGYVRFANGGRDVGEYLTQHDAVEEIHITGGNHSHDAIVYGSGPEGAERKARGELLTTKRITSELGSITPILVLPGPWTEADLRYQAERIVTFKMHNAGCNCVSGQVLVLPQDWEQKDALLEAVRTVFREIGPRYPYYTGAEQRYRAAAEAHDGALELIDASEGEVPRALIMVDAADTQAHSFRNELFGGQLAVTQLPGRTAAEFLRAGVAFSNDVLHGSLGVNIIAHPRTLRELGPVLEEAIADLRYGAIGVNVWCAAVYLLANNPWGGYANYPDEMTDSGRGMVHNAFMFSRAQKGVAYGHFYPFPRNLLHGEWHISPRPAWFVTNKQAATLGRRFSHYEYSPGFRHLPGLFFAALRG